MQNTQSNKAFKHGASWIRADFHLHTRADGEFQYVGEKNDFINQYIDKLKESKISLAVITNHNQFDYSEYKTLLKKARKEEIYMLPGVELSVNDGANGIHTLVIFDQNQWLEGENDFINQFITSTFSGHPSYETNNRRSNDSLNQTIKKLEEFRKNFFIIMAHIEQKSGFYAELDGGRIIEFAKNISFRDAVLAFQKVRTRDKTANLNKWFEGRLPAFIEGSDPKSIDEIGEGKKTFIKIGDYNFDAIKYALMDYEYRVSKEIPQLNQAYIKSISFTSGKQDIKQIFLNPAMNNLIGIRGSGKSSILETLRYSLDIDLDNTRVDKQYKDGLITNFLGSGGKTRLEVIDHYGNLIVAEKILGDRTNIYEDGILNSSLKISGVLKKPLYFGQKDLSNIKSSDGIESLINQLIGEKVKNLRQRITDKNGEIISLLNNRLRQDKLLAQHADIKARKASLEHNLKVFKEKKVDVKLNKQIEFNKDANRFKYLLEFEKNVIDNFEELISDNSNFKSYLGYKSKENENLFEKAYQSFENFTNLFNQFLSLLTQMKKEKANLAGIEKQFINKYENLKEEFSKIKREINLPDIKADDYVRFSKELENTNFKLSELEKIKEKSRHLQEKLIVALTELQRLWNEDFKIMRAEVEKINDAQSSIRIEMRFKSDKEKFKEFLKDSIRGTNIRERSIQLLVDSYSDLIEIYRDLHETATSAKVRDILSNESQFEAFKSRFNENLEAFLTYRVPDYFEIFYKEKPLADQSLGQRASALIILLLSLKENDVIIIDQPEDDLDNQTIYNDVIRVLRDLKTKTQFIFATHNPNIPVLGDCEQVISCHYDNEKISTHSGSIDDITIHEQIVTIMEGGDTAFERRKKIYELWKQ